MSIDSCKKCGHYVDTDNDCDAYCIPFEDDSATQLDYCICSGCRETISNQYRSAEAYRDSKLQSPKTAAIIEKLLDNPDSAEEILAKHKGEA